MENLEQREAGRKIRVMGWTSRIAELMYAADMMVSKLGNSFDEAIVAELAIVALEPPPGSERVQYKLLNQWGIGCAVRTLDEMADAVARLLQHPAELDAMRKRARTRRLTGAAERVAQWLKMKCDLSRGRAEYRAASALVVNG
jgi:UDP-N-acetylglucosamine:LPS N-acetylglucosamine transferase